MPPMVCTSALIFGRRQSQGSHFAFQIPIVQVNFGNTWDDDHVLISTDWNEPFRKGGGEILCSHCSQQQHQ